MKRLRLPFLYISLVFLLASRIVWFNSEVPMFKDGQEVVLTTKLEAEPRIDRGSYVLKVNNLTAYVPIKKPLHSGDTVLLRGIWKRSYIDKTEVEILGRQKMEAGFSPRQELRKVYKTILKPRAADVISGMVLGSDEMDRRLKNDMSGAGLIHLVVASGVNLTLLGGLLIAVFTNFRMGRTVTGLIISCAVIMYAWLTGFNPPIVRALIMFEAVLLGGMVGRRSGGTFGLMAAGYIMLWVNPSLMTSYSFLLSFASMASQIFLSTIKVAVPKVIEPIVLVILQNFLAIVFTLPIILVGFAKFSLISIVSNLLVVLTIEPLMVLGGLAGIIGLASTQVARLVLTPAGYILDYFLWVVDVFGKDGRFVMEVPGVNVFIAVGYYLLLSALIYSYVNRKTTWPSRQN